MKTDIKEKWVAALRSGEYKQGRMALKNTDDNPENPTYCCLGVLCELAVKEGVIDPPRAIGYEVEGDNPYRYYTHYYGVENVDASSGYLPDSVAVWAGISTNQNPEVTPEAYDKHLSNYDDIGRALSLINDSGVVNFDKIATLIEESF